MKSLSILFLFLAANLTVFAQGNDQTFKIAISVIMPDSHPNMDSGQLSKIEAKMMQIATRNGMGGTGNGATFVMFPMINVYDINEIENPMGNQFMATVNITFVIKNAETKQTFGSYSKDFKGTNKSVEQAINQAIGRINASDAVYTKFVEEAKEKIVKFYELSCQDILNKSKALKSGGKYAEALSTLKQVPTSVSCYSEVTKETAEVYKSIQNAACKKYLANAQALLSTAKYTEAIAELMKIDPESSCFSEVAPLVKAYETKIDAENLRVFQAQMESYKDQVALEKMRIEAERDILMEYHKSNATPAPTYNTLMK